MLGCSAGALPLTVRKCFHEYCDSGFSRWSSSCALAVSSTTLALLQEVLYFRVEVKGNMTAPHLDLPQGTLDLLILRTLSLGPQHGWAISERVQQMSSDALRIQQGSLYPALHRLERRGLVKASWGTTENNRRAKYYELSKKGREQLEVEREAWAKLTAAVAQVLGTV